MKRGIARRLLEIGGLLLVSEAIAATAGGVTACGNSGSPQSRGNSHDKTGTMAVTS